MPKTIDSLIADLTNTDREIRMEAISELVEIGVDAQSSIPALKIVMANPEDRYLQVLAAGAISSIDPSDLSPTPVLVQGLKESATRLASIEFLGERRSKTAVLNAMSLLSDEDFLVRFATGKAIGKVVGDYFHAVAVCVAMLKDENETKRVIGGNCLLSIRRYVRDHLDLLPMAMVDVSWEARIDIEEVLHQLRTG